jgi:hypothetical protein
MNNSARNLLILSPFPKRSRSIVLKMYSTKVLWQLLDWSDPDLRPESTLLTLKFEWFYASMITILYMITHSFLEY